MAQYDVILIRNAAPADFGGAERYVVFLAQELKQHGLKPIIFTHHSEITNFAETNLVNYQRTPWLKQQNWNGWRTLLLPFYGLFQIYLFFYYLRTFIKYRPQTIHVQSKDDFIAATYAGKLLGKTIIWGDHADLKHILKNTTKFGRNLAGKMVLGAAKKADKIVLNSHGDKEAIAESIPKDHWFWSKTTVIHNGAIDRINEYAKKPSEKFKFILNCRLVTSKGVNEAIAAFKKISKRHTNIQLLIVGDGPEAAKFKQKAKSNPKIEFLGYQIDPLAFLTQADCFLQPTYHEGLSLSLVEACMLQKPIITTNVGGNPEVITNQKNGLLIPAKDIKALEEAMELIYQKPKLAEKLAKQARQTYLESFDFKQLVAKELIPLYNIKVNDKPAN